MKKSPSILELNNYVTLARMLSILGQYEKALSNYNISLQIIKERKTQVNNTPLKDIWNDLENVINTEISLTDETLKISQKFQITYNPRAVPIEEWNNKKTKIPIPFYMYCHLKGYDYDKKVTEILQQEIMEKNTNVKYTNIFGLDDNINILKETVLLPLLIPEFFIGVRHPPKGVLLFGPPGMGKTLLSKALASEGKINFFNISPVVLIKKWKGESVKIVRIIFEMAKFYAPSIVHIDEVDLIGKRKYEYDYENVSVSWKLMGEIIEQMDKINSQFCRDDYDISKEEMKNNCVMIIGETNLPWDLNETLRKKFEKKIYFPFLNLEPRKNIIKNFLKEFKLEDGFDIDRIAQMIEGYTGAEIINLCREATLKKIYRRNGKIDFNQLKNILNKKTELILDTPISQRDFEDAIRSVFRDGDIRPYMMKYEKFMVEYGNH